MKPYPLALVALLCGHAGAALITVTADVGWSCGTGTGGFEPTCTPDVERGTLAFTYDTSIPDSDPGPFSGRFVGAITGFRMQIDQTTRPGLDFKLTQPGMVTTFYGGTSRDDYLLRLSVNTTDDTLGAGSFWLNIYSTSYGFHGGSPNAVPALSFWTVGHPFGYVGDGYGVNETDWAPFFSASEASAVPEPRTMALLLAGIGAATATRRRTLKGRDEVQGLRT